MIQITIDKVSQDKVKFGIKTTIESGRNKYSFFSTKKDGNPTMAAEQFERFGFKVGDSVNAEVSEEDKSFTNKEGKLINYTERTIKFFETLNDNTPVVRTAPKQEIKQGIGIDNWSMEKIVNMLNDHESIIKELKEFMLGSN